MIVYTVEELDKNFNNIGSGDEFEDFLTARDYARFLLDHKNTLFSNTKYVEVVENKDDGAEMLLRFEV